MKYTGFEDIDAGVRSAILISVAAAYFAYDIGFELGAHGSIFFEFAAVVVSFPYVLYVGNLLGLSENAASRAEDRNCRCDGYIGLGGVPGGREP